MGLGSLPAAGISILLLDQLPTRNFLDSAVLPVLGIALLVTAAALVFRSWVTKIAHQLVERSGEPSDFWIVVAGVVLGCLVTLSSGWSWSFRSYGINNLSFPDVDECDRWYRIGARVAAGMAGRSWPLAPWNGGL